MLPEVFKYHNDQMAALVGKEYASGTLDRYKASYKHTQPIVQWKYKLAYIDITKFNFWFISKY